ncbi:ATP-binding cassette domain-containing protein [Nonomuraea sp. NPDC048882]|uniref:ATP-binding cassette domain-containing protein n=1 Tax=Nonomuraea sp. NPDC048882 TaxID=3154347 RepID=UPI0033C3E8FF
MTADEPAIQVHGLEKSFKELRVLRGVDFEVARGGIFALLGSNGAGKTTVVKILSTLLKADAGAARAHGFDVATQPRHVRESISLTGSSPPLTRSSAGGRTWCWSPGLDPQARIEVWQAVRELAGRGTTVLLTTQYLDEAEQLADPR